MRAQALVAPGLLGALHRAGVLGLGDLHVARRLGAACGEDDEQVLLALALAVRAARQGAVVLRLDEVAATVTPDDGEAGADVAPLPPWPEPGTWLDAVRRSPLADGPLRVEGDGVWLARAHREEVAVARELLARAADPPAVDAAVLRDALARLWPGTGPDDQRRAAAVCALHRVAVLGGGPGTGKTTTVARLLAALHAVAPAPPRVALAAPTGRAAARLLEAVRGAACDLAPEDRERLSGLSSSTLHRLLGIGRGSRGPWHTAANRLPHDVVVVDEASMLSLSLMARLLDALRPTARLVLVGDPDQLASVEAGAVLADLVDPARGAPRSADLAARLAEVAPHDALPGTAPGPPGPGQRLRDGVVLLSRVRRFDEGGAIAALADAVRTGDAEAALAVLRGGDPAVGLVEVPDDEPVSGAALALVRRRVVEAAAAVLAPARAGDAAGALQALSAHRLLLAHRRGPRGVTGWSADAARWIAADLGVVAGADGRYPGLALLVTANDPDSGLWNGDSGVLLPDPSGEGLLAAFGSGTGAPLLVPAGRLGDVEPLHASTVHRAQGSQAEAVTVVLPPATSPLGARQTLYTAVTRAVREVRVVGSAEAVRAAVGRPVARATGLRARLAEPGPRPAQ